MFLDKVAQASFFCRDSGYDDLASIDSASEMNFAASLASSDFLIDILETPIQILGNGWMALQATYQFNPSINREVVH